MKLPEVTADCATGISFCNQAVLGCLWSLGTFRYARSHTGHQPHCHHSCRGGGCGWDLPPPLLSHTGQLVPVCCSFDDVVQCDLDADKEALSLQANGMRTHMKSCVQKKSYLCEFCPSKFKQLQSLRAHVLTHTGQSHTHTQTHMLTHTHTHTHVLTHTHAHTHTCSHTHMLTHTGQSHTHTHTETHTQVHSDTDTCAHTHRSVTHTHIQVSLTHTYTYIHTQVSLSHTQTHTHIYTHTGQSFTHTDTHTHIHTHR